MIEPRPDQMELPLPARYWMHAESGCVWISTKDELLESDGCVVEIDRARYDQILREGYTSG